MICVHFLRQTSSIGCESNYHIFSSAMETFISIRHHKTLSSPIFFERDSLVDVNSITFLFLLIQLQTPLFLYLYVYKLPQHFIHTSNRNILRIEALDVKNSFSQQLNFKIFGIISTILYCYKFHVTE